MTVVERTPGGYVKGVDKNGNTFHRDPNGHPVKQQSYAGSKGGAATGEIYSPVRDPDTGEFTGEKVLKDTTGGMGPPGRERITISCNNDYSKRDGTGDVQYDFEVSALVPVGSVSDRGLEGMVESMVDQINADIPFVTFPECMDISPEDSNVERSLTRSTRETGFDGTFHLNDAWGNNHNYDIDDFVVRWE